MTTTETKQVCRITVTFPVDTDEQAIEIKKKIAVVLDSLPDSQVQFSLMNLPTKPPMG